MPKSFLLCLTLLFSSTILSAQSADKATLTNVSFKEISAKDVIMNLARNLSLNVTFDESVAAMKDSKISFSASDVTLAQSIEIVMVMRGWRAKLNSEGSLLIYVDEESTRQRLTKLPDWSHRKYDRK